MSPTVINADGCPELYDKWPFILDEEGNRTDAIAWPDHSRPMALAFVSVWFATSIPFLLLLYVHRAHPYLQQRPLGLVVAYWAGCSLEAVLGPGREAITRDVFPCGAYLWLTYMVPVLVATPLVTRVIMFYNSAMLSKLQGEVSYEKLQQQNAVRMQADGAMNDSNVCNDVALTVKGFFTAGILSRRKHELRRVDTMGSITGDEILDMRRRASTSFAVVILVSMFLISAILPLALTLSSTIYRSGCVGCIFYRLEQLMLLVLISIYGVMAFYLLRKIYNLKDPLGILREGRNTLILMCLGSILGIGIDFVDPGHLSNDGNFTWSYIVCVGLMGGFYVQAAVPLVRGVWGDVSRRARNAEEFGSLEDLFADEGSEWHNAFKAHLVAEFSIENLRFWLEATKFKTSFEADMDLSQTKAREIFNTFIPSSAFLEVNLPAKIKKNLLSEFARKPGAAQREVAKEVFDAAIADIYKLMSTDSFSRFVRSDAYNELQEHVPLVLAGASRVSVKA